MAAAGLLPLALPPLLKAAAAILLVLSLAWSLRKVLRPPFIGLRLLADGCVEALHADGETATLRVLADTTVLPWLVVLRLRGNKKGVALVLPPDAVSGGGHRELRLWLRWKASATA